MKFLQTLNADLRERQILPAVLVLAVLAIAIPIVASLALSKSTTPAQPTVAEQPVSLPKGVAPPTRELVLLTSPTSVKAKTRSGSEPNPFRVASVSGSASAPTKSSTTTSSSSGSRSTGATTIPSQPPPSTTPTTTTRTTPTRTAPAKTAPKVTPSKPPTTKPKSTTPKHQTKPNGGSAAKPTPLATATPTTGPATLKPSQAYTVNIDTKDANGAHALSDVVRLAPLPAAQTPEVIYLGVVSGGKMAAFLFTNAVKVSGASSQDLNCLPSNDDCQIVELSPGQGMRLTPTSNTALISSFTFELMSISAQNFASASSATQARDAVSTAGQTLLPLYDSPALQSLRFDAQLGALVHHSVPSGGAGGSTGSSGATAATGTTGTTGTTGSGGTSNAERPGLRVTFAAAPLR
jgi:hypothetical protein